MENKNLTTLRIELKNRETIFARVNENEVGKILSSLVSGELMNAKFLAIPGAALVIAKEDILYIREITF